MGCIHNCACCNRTKHLIISLLFLLTSSLTQVTFMAEGRSIPKLVEAPQEREVVVERKLIGSRPPRCERKCISYTCGHCEAVQVPIVPQFKSHTTTTTNHHLVHFSTIANSRGDDISNYKPMSWKCKCGDFIFNP